MRRPWVETTISFQVPGVRGLDSKPAEVAGEYGAELLDPAPHRFIRNLQAALRQKFLDVSQAERNRGYNQTACRMTAGGKRWEMGCMPLPFPPELSAPEVFVTMSAGWLWWFGMPE
jgi:hypothetical protein